MDYIYDIVLNFQNEYYEFYEWKNTDKIINIKKIPVYLTNNQDYLNLKYNDVTLDTKILPKSIKLFLITNGLEVMGILIDSYGRVIKRSSLLLDEADEVLEEKETIKALPLKYKKNIITKQVSISRINLEKVKFIEKYLSNIDINKDKYLLKYIHYDIYQKEEIDIIKIYKELKELLTKDIDKVYNTIKKVSIELKN